MYADDEYKQRVLEVAKRVKEENGWCKEGLREALAELDITPPVERIKIHVKFEVSFYADVKDGVPEEFALANSMENPDFESVFPSYTGLENVEVDDISSWVEEIEDADED